MNEFKVNQEVVKAIETSIDELQKLGEVKRDGIIITCNQEMVDTILFFSKKFTVEELVRMRNNYVYVLAEKISQVGDNEKVDYQEVDRLNALMTVITRSIDRRIHNGVYVVDD